MAHPVSTQPRPRSPPRVGPRPRAPRPQPRRHCRRRRLRRHARARVQPDRLARRRSLRRSVRWRRGHADADAGDDPDIADYITAQMLFSVDNPDSADAKYWGGQADAELAKVLGRVRAERGEADGGRDRGRGASRCSTSRTASARRAGLRQPRPVPTRCRDARCARVDRWRASGHEAAADSAVLRDVAGAAVAGLKAIGEVLLEAARSTFAAQRDPW